MNKDLEWNQTLNKSNNDSMWNKSTDKNSENQDSCG